MDNHYAYSYTKSNGETRILYSETPPHHKGVSDMSYSVMTSGYSHVISAWVEYPKDKGEER